MNKVEVTLGEAQDIGFVRKLVASLMLFEGRRTDQGFLSNFSIDYAIKQSYVCNFVFSFAVVCYKSFVLDVAVRLLRGIFLKVIGRCDSVEGKQVTCFIIGFDDVFNFCYLVQGLITRKLRCIPDIVREGYLRSDRLCSRLPYFRNSLYVCTSSCWY